MTPSWGQGVEVIVGGTHILHGQQHADATLRVQTSQSVGDGTLPCVAWLDVGVERVEQQHGEPWIDRVQYKQCCVSSHNELLMIKLIRLTATIIL